MRLTKEWRIGRGGAKRCSHMPMAMRKRHMTACMRRYHLAGGLGRGAGCIGRDAWEVVSFVVRGRVGGCWDARGDVGFDGMAAAPSSPPGACVVVLRRGGAVSAAAAAAKGEEMREDVDVAAVPDMQAVRESAAGAVGYRATRLARVKYERGCMAPGPVRSVNAALEAGPRGPKSWHLDAVLFGPGSLALLAAHTAVHCELSNYLPSTLVAYTLLSFSGQQR